jgi:hypothetical protein
MKKMSSFIIRFCWSILGFCWLLSFFAAPEPPRDVQIAAVERGYSFDPVNVQQSIREGKTNIFHREYELNLHRVTPETLIPEPPTLLHVIPKYPFPKWNEADFERVIRASSQLLAKDPLDDYKLAALEFQSVCQYPYIGSHIMIFSFFKVMSNEEHGNYSRRKAFVNISTGRLTWIETQFSEIVYEDRILEREGNYIPAETALNIAEEAGGSSFRSRQSNSCIIRGWLNTDITRNEWRISYQDSFQTFEVQIDARTSKPKIVTTPSP